MNRLIAEGKRADLVLWDPAFFGVKPEMVLLGGTIVVAQMGDPNASIPTPQPVHMPADVRRLWQVDDQFFSYLCLQSRR